MKTVILSTLAATAPLLTAATLIDPSAITGHHQGDSLSGSGSILTTTNKAGITQTGGADSPVTWTHNSAWQNDWQGNQLSGATNSKLGWAVIDFGSTQTQLGEMLLWNVNEGSHSGRGMNAFNIYFATSPSVSAPAISATPTDYDFSSGGWTQLGATRNLTRADESGVNALDGSFDLSSIASAQYIGIEILSTHGENDRAGFAEVVFTAVPEPSSISLLGLGSLTLLLRRKRR
ncbi:PEP-CTERM sorting domain-containing protein [Rubritalea tangerina]|uniref:PEP-CTERM sorting domain-containing protein n=1 Tax=Rubritalea tangerina TaxID=430798 RepID=A0ABW4ZG60_9BACT